jgi:hypothetical protein
MKRIGSSGLRTAGARVRPELRGWTSFLQRDPAWALRSHYNADRHGIPRDRLWSNLSRKLSVMSVTASEGSSGRRSDHKVETLASFKNFRPIVDEDAGRLRNALFNSCSQG